MKVLLADDDLLFRTLVTEVLSEAGYEVAAYENGLLAWEGLQAEGADMAVLDVNMPEMDGIQLLGHIRGDARFTALPVLMLTIRSMVDDQVESYDRGADDYLTKPFANEVLVARMKVLERRILGEPQ
jgi:DNA-binding response OmpR family regulator